MCEPDSPQGEGEDERPPRERRRERRVTFQPHDLLRVDPAAVAGLSRDLPGWAAAALAAMIAAGATPIDTEPRPGSRGTTVAFVHPKGSFGTLIELVQE